jgi:hypothetical protein
MALPLLVVLESMQGFDQPLYEYRLTLVSAICHPIL